MLIWSLIHSRPWITSLKSHYSCMSSTTGLHHCFLCELGSCPDCLPTSLFQLLPRPAALSGCFKSSPPWGASPSSGLSELQLLHLVLLPSHGVLLLPQLTGPPALPSLVAPPASPRTSRFTDPVPPALGPGCLPVHLPGRQSSNSSDCGTIHLTDASLDSLSTPVLRLSCFPCLPEYRAE